MQPVELKPPAPENAPSASRARSDAAHPSRSGSEGFDAVMGRALARSSRETTDDSESEPSSPDDRRPPESRKADSTNTSALEHSVCADPSPPPPAPEQSASARSGAIEGAAESPGDNAAASEEIAAGSEGTSSGIAGTTLVSGNSDLASELSPLTGNISSDKTSALPAATQAQGESTGISGAKYHVAHQKAENMNNFSGSPEQNLPMNTASGAEESPKAVHPAGFKLPEGKSEASAAPATSFSGASPVDETAAAAIGASDWPSSVRSVERTHDLMALQAVRLRESGQDSLHVVIKPDAGLQLSLNLQMRDGNVEMRALLHRGNFELLNLHWPELQQQLESRGIRLGPLTQGEPATDSQSFSQSQNQQTSDQHVATDGAFAEFALNSTLVPKPARTETTSSRGWESWA